MKCENEYELKYWPKSIMGIDEAGRGPLAGPLVVCGLILPKNYINEEIYDSKKLSKKKREELYDLLIEKAIDYKVLIIDEKTIDKNNIYQATKNAMSEIAVSLNAEIVLSDAMKFSVLDKLVIPIVKGDQKSQSIAGASIIAKVVRDRIMEKYNEIYPLYDFINNKGYGTKKHIEAIEKHGILPIHRKSFAPVKDMLKLKLF